MKELTIIWIILGIIGFFLYCSNGNTRPKKMSLLCAAFCTHTIFGPISLFYGYFCFIGRKLKIKE